MTEIGTQTFEDRPDRVHVFAFPEAVDLKLVSDAICAEFVHAGVLVVGADLKGQDIQTMDVEEFDDWFFDSGKPEEISGVTHCVHCDEPLSDDATCPECDE